jgi:hypothetical protein
MNVIVPVTNDASIAQFLPLKDQIRAGDWLTVNSGGVDRPADPIAVQRRAGQVAAAVPGVSVYAFTSGFSNVQLLAGQLKSPIVGVFYDYEPNYANEPEFSFDPGVTKTNLARATAVARAHGLELVGYLTGQGLFNPQHTWNYADFRGSADRLVLQTQSALRHDRWKEALDRLDAQFGADKPPVQITFSPGLPNAVDVPTAIAAFDELERRGYRRVELWWPPGGIGELQALLGHRNLAPASHP